MFTPPPSPAPPRPPRYTHTDHHTAEQQPPSTETKSTSTPASSSLSLAIAHLPITNPPPHHHHHNPPLRLRLSIITSIIILILNPQRNLSIPFILSIHLRLTRLFLPNETESPNIPSTPSNPVPSTVRYHPLAKLLDSQLSKFLFEYYAGGVV
ncbi:hypothetical protein NLI96_g4839 [Meripilus lineatus]|uniref:Uncharacterized protein n=1 Tax=Meripilus lineatus TaxID=2056292 RepID=A0AAD5V6E3_9APHY|nr:hypothetical protein NLI96_g4839 [Physisporinus lineatus]